MDKYSKESQEIFKLFDNLTSWDKADMIKYLSTKHMTWEEIEKYFIEGSGYVRWEDVDLVKEVINEGLENEVLDEMDERDICDYLLRGWNAKENIQQMLRDGDTEDIADAISDLSDYSIKEIFENIQKDHPEVINQILKYIISYGLSVDIDKLNDSSKKFKEALNYFVKTFERFNNITKNE